MGHGVAAALVMAGVRAGLRDRAVAAGGLADLMGRLNRLISADHHGDRFMTMHLSVIDSLSRTMRWVSAGHPAPLLIRDGRFIKTLDVAPSPPLALALAVGTPAEGRESLEPGDMVLLYTDGLTESRRPGGELFSVERLGEFIEREAASGRAAPETLRRLREAIIERGAGALNDDATAVLVEWRRGTERLLLPDTV